MLLEFDGWGFDQHQASIDPASVIFCSLLLGERTAT
jgi:hypothetical protein